MEAVLALVDLQEQGLDTSEFSGRKTLAPIRTTTPKNLFGRTLQLVAKRLPVAEFGRFLTSGGVAAGTNFLAAWLIRLTFVGTPRILELSVTLGFVLGTVVSFLLNRSFTFRSRAGDVRGEFLRFMALGIVLGTIAGFVAKAASIVLTWGMPISLGNASINALSHVFTIGFMTIVNYLLIKYVVFSKPTAAPRYDRMIDGNEVSAQQ